MAEGSEQLMAEAVDPLSYADGYREAHAELRARCPVSSTPTGPWYLATYERVDAATRDVDTFLASFRAPGVVVPPEEQFINEIAPPRHGQVRKILNAALATAKVMQLEPQIRSVCNDLLDVLLAKGRGDLVDAYVRPVPNIAIALVLGARPDHWDDLARWSDELVHGTYPTQYRNERGEGLAGAHPEFTAYVDGLIAERRAMPEPGDDLIGRLLTEEVEGQRLTDVEARTQLVFLFASGNETTRHLIGNMLHRLATEPQLYAALRADRALIHAAVEESLRMDSPIQHLFRDCRRDVELEGQELHAGDKVVFGISSANRDEARFDDADSFRLDRPNPRGHIAFGGGPHVCPGANIARLEARVAVETLLDRVATIEVAPGHEFEKTPVFWAYGPTALPVTLTPA
jgi:cytochrome P450